MQGIGIAVKAGATKKHFDTTVGIHPSLAEVGHTVVKAVLLTFYLGICVNETKNSALHWDWNSNPISSLMTMLYAKWRPE